MKRLTSIVMCVVLIVTALLPTTVLATEKGFSTSNSVANSTDAEKKPISVKECIKAEDELSEVESFDLKNISTKEELSEEDDFDLGNISVEEDMSLKEAFNAEEDISLEEDINTSFEEELCGSIFAGGFEVDPSDTNLLNSIVNTVQAQSGEAAANVTREFLIGSYRLGEYPQFTDSRYVEGINLRSIQCYGFANFFYYKLCGHTTYENSYMVADETLNNAARLKQVLAASKAGAHIRVPNHSMIYLMSEDGGFYLLHWNFGVTSCSYTTYQGFVSKWAGQEFSVEMPNDYPVSVSHDPKICLDSVVSDSTGKVTVSGWAFDQDNTAEKISVHTYAFVNGQTYFLGNTTANTYRPDVHSVYGCGDYHGFSATFDSPVVGTAEIQAAAINIGSGNNTWSEKKVLEIKKDDERPRVSINTPTDISSAGYTLTCNVTDNVGVQKVVLETWTEDNKEDIVYQEVTDISNGVVSFQVNTSDHSKKVDCYYHNNVIAYDYAGNSSDDTTTIGNYVPLPISNIQITDISSLGYIVSCTIDKAWGIDYVEFPTWTKNNGQDDLIWHKGIINGDTATFNVKTSDHNNETNTKYITQIYVRDNDGHSSHSECWEVSVSNEQSEWVIDEWTVGDGVTAKLVKENDKVVLYFDSKSGTLWQNWKGSALIAKSPNGFLLNDIDIIKFTDQSTKMFLPEYPVTIEKSDYLQMYTTVFSTSHLESIDLEKVDTSRVLDMRYMFWGDKFTGLDVSSFDTSKTVDMRRMFTGCKSLTSLDLSNFDTSNVTNMEYMFADCENLEKLDISSFDMSAVTDTDSMFFQCNGLQMLRTPKTNTKTDIALPITMYDSEGNEYTELPVLSKSIVLARSKEEAQQYEKTGVDKCTISLSPLSYTFNGKQRKPTITVTDGTVTLTSGTDYTVKYSNNTNAGTATVTITGKGNYTGTISKTFTIKKAPAKLTFENVSLTKTTTDAAFTNTLTKMTDGTVTFKSGDTKVASVDSTSGLVTINGAGTTTITATASEGQNYKAGNASYTLKIEAPAPTPTSTPTASGFSDVQDPKHAFYNAIYWAANAGITKGYPDGTFGVDRDCTRGEMMMFLWRYSNKPAPKEVSKSPFKDVPMNHAFYNAILWGSQKGITKGYPDGSFGINRNVSRGECMMFLWRLKNKPAPKAVAKTPFPDVPKSHAFYNAILWGYQKKITNGFTSGPLKGKFGINENCSRGQIVTFLYRAK